MAIHGGIDLGGTKIQTVIVDDDHTVLGSARRPTPTTGGPPEVAAEMEEALRDAAKAAELEPQTLAGVGVGSPGTIDGATSRARATCPTGKATSRSRRRWRTALGCRVGLGNDVQVATDAEFKLGAGRQYDSLLGVFWGTGVGGGLILDGKPWTGRGGAGEIGHIVVELDGARCTCGRRGCMEAYAGRASMEAHVARARREGPARPTCSS